MIKAIIIDDETHIRDGVRIKIEKHFSEEISIVAEASTVEMAFDAIEKLEPDLLFLDIHMGDGTGFDLIERCNNKKFKVIFITGFDNHALKAIKVGALDYILKPVDEDELIIAAKKALSTPSTNDLEKLIEVSNEFFKGVKKKRIILKTADAVYAVYEDDIIYCQSDGSYTTFFTQQLEKIVISKSLKKVEEILTEEVFVRCHQSYIVNKRHVLKYDKQGVLVVHLDFKIPVSSRRRDYALNRIFD